MLETMNKNKYVAPEWKVDGFNCPNPDCGFFAHQVWDNLHNEDGYNVENFMCAKCERCGVASVWKGHEMIYPYSTSIPSPNEDLDKEIKKIYLEATSIFQKSPRASAALLRLSIQKLCVQLGKKGENINQDIGELVSDGLPPKIQQALDIVRVIGNNAVHPGEINLDDNQHTARRIFDLINLISYTMITQPKEIDSIYDSLPDTSKKAIELRDN